MRIPRPSRRLLIVPPIVLGVAILGMAVKSRQSPQQEPVSEKARTFTVAEVQQRQIQPQIVGYGLARAARVWRAVARVNRILAVGFEEAKTLRRKSEAQRRSDRRAGALVYDLALESDRIRQAKGGKTPKKSSLKQARAEEQTRLRHQEILDRSAQPPSVNPAMTAAAKVPAIRTPISRPSNIPDLIDLE